MDSYFNLMKASLKSCFVVAINNEYNLHILIKEQKSLTIFLLCGIFIFICAGVAQW